MMRRAGSRAAAFARSLVLLGAFVVGVPWALIVAAEARFGGRAPLHGVPGPADWDADRIWSALTDRLTDRTVADIVIRTSLVVAWAAVAVLLATVVAEAVHMVRHDGLPMPDIRGLGLSQRTARVIASGLLVVVPMFTSPTRAVARDSAVLVPVQRPSATLVVGRTDAPAPSVQPASDDAIAGDGRGTYVVRPGDSIYGIAERFAGAEAGAVADYAERLIDLNLGAVMPDGQRFTNAAYIDIGWVLQLPAVDAPAPDNAAARDAHVVEQGETLWSIADDELGDPERWPELYEANAGRTFDDGRTLSDPDLIHPGWDLAMPVEESALAAAPAVDAEPASTENVWIPKDVDPSAPDRLIAVELDVRAQAEAGSAVDRGAASTPAIPEAAADLGSGAPAPARRELAAPDAADRVQSTAEAPLPAPDAASAGALAPAPPDGAGPDDAAGPRLLALGGAAMLSAGVLTLLAVRRRGQLRRARPRARVPEPNPEAAATERTLRAIGSSERFERVEVAIRAAAMPLVAAGRRVVAALVAADGEVELRLSGPAELPPPWQGEGDRWSVAAATPVELLADDARRVAAPCPTLVQLGRAVDGRDVYVDLEAVEAIEVGGPGDQADAVVAAVAATLAGSVLAEVTTLVGVGVADEAFLGHRNHVAARDVQRAFEAAAEAIGSTASMTAPTFELRARAEAGETWEPAVVLIGSAAGTVVPPRSRAGLAVVSASPIHGPSSRLAPAGDAWDLLPAGIRLLPVGLSPADVTAIAGLVRVVDARVPDVQVVDDRTIVTGPDGIELDALPPPVAAPTDAPEPAVAAEVPAQLPAAVPAAVPAEPAWQLLVRLLGPVDVVGGDGRSATFERSKARELVAWLATHRARSTRGAARTALWELDVRDATVANVVSEARRSLARLVEPPEGEEWVGRTMTGALPLHALVVTDADLLEWALEVAALQPPAQAIATLEPAVARIVGMPFEGTSYLWPDAEGLTSNLVLLATSAATELAAHCLSLGDIDGVFRATGRGLQVLPGHEELIGLRMQAHARAGDHAGVRQEWESYERVLHADPWSDGEPSPKLVELRRTLLNPSC